MLERVTPAEAVDGAVSVAVETKSDAFAFSCRPGESILAAGLAAGYRLPYECATGTCGSCRARVASGDVDPGWVDAPGYRKLKRDKGDVLMCQALALTPCSLRVPITAAQPATLAPNSLNRTGRVDAVRRLTRDVLEFDTTLSSPMDFMAGQFVTLHHPDLVGHRAYSMVNYGQGVEKLVFVLKRKHDGGFSQLAFEGDLVGSDIDVLGPLGRATFDPAENHDILCIAGGSGIAGMMAILEHANVCRYFDDHRGHVFFGVRTLADAFYVEHFAEHLARAGENLVVTIAISDEAEVPTHHPDHARVQLAAGMVHDVAARTLEQPWPNGLGFVAGPQPMVDAALRVLITKAGLTPARIRFDKFS